MIDTHCHLNLPPLSENIKEILGRAETVGVSKIIVPGVSIETSQLSVEVSNKYDNVFAAVGVHPHEASQQRISEIERLLKTNTSIVAVGEVGLDFSQTIINKPEQFKCFEQQITLAKMYSKPLIIHSRDAYMETAHILKEMGTPSAVIHCFTGSYSEAKALLDLGCFISVTGILTYRSSEVLRDTIKSLPLERLFLETDSPYLAPQRQRGKSNEPSFLLEVAEVLATIFEKPLQEINSRTTAAAETFFRLNKNQTV